MMSLLVFNNFYPVISYRRVRKKRRKERIIVFANQLPVQGVKNTYIYIYLYTYISDLKYWCSYSP